MSPRGARRAGLQGDVTMIAGSNPFTLRYMVLRAVAFVVLTAGTTCIMALPYLA